MSSGNSSSFSMPQNQEKKQIPRYEVRFTNKNHPFMWLVCKTRAKILLSNQETSLTTTRLLPLRRSRRSYGNYQSPQSPRSFWPVDPSGSSRNILKRLGRSGRSGRSYGNQALVRSPQPKRLDSSILFSLVKLVFSSARIHLSITRLS